MRTFPLPRLPIACAGALLCCAAALAAPTAEPPAPPQQTDVFTFLRAATETSSPRFGQLEIGVSTRADVLATLGQPSHQENDSSFVWRETSQCRDLGLASIACGLDPMSRGDPLGLIALELLRPLSRDEIVRRLRITEEPTDIRVAGGHIHAYPESGVELRGDAQGVILILLETPSTAQSPTPPDPPSERDPLALIRTRSGGGQSAFLELQLLGATLEDAIALLGEPNDSPFEGQSRWNDARLTERWDLSVVEVRVGPDGRLLDRIGLYPSRRISPGVVTAALGLGPSPQQKPLGNGTLNFHPESGVAVWEGADGEVVAVMLYVVEATAPPEPDPVQPGPKPEPVEPTPEPEPPQPPAEVAAAFLEAVRSGDLARLVAFLDEGVPVTTRGAGGRTALHLAALTDNRKLFDMLLAYASLLDVRDDTGLTPLHAAALAGQADCVSALLSRGADPRLCDRDGDTPADLSDDPGIRRRLIEAVAGLPPHPDTEAVRALVTTFLQALGRQDRAALAGCVEPRYAERIPSSAATPARILYELPRIALQGESATVTALLHYPDVTDWHNRYVLTLELQELPVGWRITGSELKSHWPAR